MLSYTVYNSVLSLGKCPSFKKLSFKKCRSDLRLTKHSFYSSKENMELYSIDTQNIVESNKTVNKIKEKTTEILEPPGKKVFYNPVQEFNRDLSVLVLQCLSKQFQNQIDSSKNNGSQKPFRILEALSATGLRSIRYAKEVPNVTEVVANDFLQEAVENIKNNIKYNNVENIVTPSHSDASALMASNIRQTNKFQVVDIDPYGSPSQFLDSAVQCVEDGGMLLVTCTDMSTLCGHYPETCYAKYGALSLKSPAQHEMALRIILQCIQSHASRYKRYIVPVLSVSVDFYIRVFVKLYTSPITCKSVIGKLSMVYQCYECGATTLQPLGTCNKKNNYSLPYLPELGGKCKYCGAGQQMGGPIWNGPIHDKEFVAEMIKANEMQSFGTSKRITGMLTMIQEELDIPLYYLSTTFSKLLKISQMPIVILRSAILNAGFQVSDSHAAKYSVKTDAPMGFLLDVFKAWMKENSKATKLLPGSPGYKVLNTPIIHEIDFSERADANPASREMGLVRYQINPFRNWGPGSRSRTKTLGEETQKKQGSKNELNENDSAKKQKTEE